MKVLLITETGDLAIAMAKRAIRDGHDPTVFIKGKDFPMIGQGLVPVIRGPVPDLEEYDFAVVSGRRVPGFPEPHKSPIPMLCPSRPAEQLEIDRRHGMQVMQDAGIEVPDWWYFDNVDKAIKFAQGHGSPLVMKPNGAKALPYMTVVGHANDNADVIAMLKLAFGKEPEIETKGIIFQELVEGTEMSAGAFFNGTDFVMPAMMTFENKRFAPSPYTGPSTGELGSFAVWDYENKLFAEVTKKVGPYLAEIGYVGDIDINTIITKDGPKALEFTLRLGFPSTCLQMQNCQGDWIQFLYDVATGQAQFYPVIDRWCVGVLLITSPAPYEDQLKDQDRYVGMPVYGLEFGKKDWNPKNFYPLDLYIDEENEPASGGTGFIGVACGTGAFLGQAQDNAYAGLNRITCTYAYARMDIGERFYRERDILRKAGYLPHMVEW